MSKSKAVSYLLYIGATFYIVGAVVHQLGLTLFPWYVAQLYSPYHDALIAISSLAMAVFFWQGARHPNNKELIDAITYVAFIGGPLIIAMGLFVDYRPYHAEAKATQAVVEGVVAILFGSLLYILRSKKLQDK